MPGVSTDGLSVYLPTYPARFRCPECDVQLRQVMTSGATDTGTQLQPCVCGYDSSLSLSRSPVPIP